MGRHKREKTFIQKFWKTVSDVFYPEKDSKIVKFKPASDKCSYCEVQKATFKNTVVHEYACDSCVPRGCSCRLYKKTKRTGFSIENYDYVKDKEGKELPCEDWIEL